MSVKCNIITCPEWGAKKPKQGITTVGRSARIIFHHTAGHHPEIENPNSESIAESEAYARAIQNQHMSQGWIDSGHNFLVCRNGVILQGRWLTVSAIQAGHMVESAHCPGQNNQIGIEHEHLGSEQMTSQQKEASSRLMAWIADKYEFGIVLPVDPHSKYFATACPGNLKDNILKIRTRAQEILTAERI